MRIRPGSITLTTVVLVTMTALMLVSGCGSAGDAAAWRSASSPSASAATSRPPATTPPATPRPTSSVVAAAAPTAGNPNGHATVPAEGKAVDASHPNRVVGTGSAASCTSEAVVGAVTAGGVITFNCGPAPVTIAMKATAKVRNTNARTVLDGGGKVTLSGGGARRILYMNTCDKALGPAKGDCLQQTEPVLTVQNLTLADGNSTGDKTEGGGGGAILVRGGRLKIVNSTFLRNKCDTTGPDLGGAAVRVLLQYHHLPNYFVNDTFGGTSGQGGSCSNGGAISGLHASLAVYNSLLAFNTAIGVGANPARDGTPGGGSGGAIYTDGNTFTVAIFGSVIEDNHAKEGGGAIFMVSNDRTGTLSIDSSTLRRNPSDGFQNSPGIFFLGAGKPKVTGSTVK